MLFSNRFYVSSHGAAINLLIWTSSLSSDFFYSSSFWLFLVLFWMLWMLVTVFKACHVRHASRITSSGILFMERPFHVSKEWVRSWSHASLIIFNKTFAETFKAVRPKFCREGERKRKAVAKCYALNRKRNKLLLKNSKIFQENIGGGGVTVVIIGVIIFLINTTE